MRTNLKIGIFIPSYNCSRQLARTMSKLNILNLSFVTSTIVIDNASTDNTVNSVLNVFSSSDLNNKEHWELVVHAKNYGLGGSFKTAVALSIEKELDYLVWLHGDDQVDLPDLEKLLAEIISAPVDAFFGSRFAPSSQLVNYSKVREYGNRALNLLFSFVLKRRIYDIGSGLAAFKVHSLPIESLACWPDHIAFDIRLLLHFFSAPYCLKQIAIKWIQTDQVSNANNILTGLQVIKELVFFKLFGYTDRSSFFNKEKAHRVFDHYYANGRKRATRPAPHHPESF
jgi:glycosyltransferase involved in cell wall biosynthesis